MFRVVLIVSVIVVGTLVNAGRFSEECLKLSNPDLFHCCKKSKPMGADKKECYNLAEPPSCEIDMCLAKKHNYLSSEDGKFDKNALEALIRTRLEPELAESIVTNCVNGDLSEFGPPEFCDLTKFRNCITIGFVSKCPEWSTEGPCGEAKQLVEKCKVK